MTVEVIEKNRSVTANISKVYTLASTLEQKQAVKVFEQCGVWLMNSTENSLACVGQLFEKSNDVEGRLRIQTRGWLIQEEK